MNNDDIHLYSVLDRYRSLGTEELAKNIYTDIEPHIVQWANGHIVSAHLAGSLAKGTAILGKSDIDILISVNHTARESLKDVYTTLFNRLKSAGYNPRKQNVSLGLSIDGMKVDIVPAKRQNDYESIHSLWSHKKNTYRETDIHKHIEYVKSSYRQNEIKLMKIWSHQNNLDVPSFPLEVLVVKALEETNLSISNNISIIFQWISDNILSSRIIDPTKTSNILSEEFTDDEKNYLKTKADTALAGTYAEAFI